MQPKQFQIEDYCRLTCAHHGAVLGHDTGLGKTWAAYLTPLLWLGHRIDHATQTLHAKGSVLHVGPDDLYEQMADDGWNCFRITNRRMENQDAYCRASVWDENRRRWVMPPGFYFTSYTALARNGVRSFPKYHHDQHDTLMTTLNLTESDRETWFRERGERFKESYDLLGATTKDTTADLDRKAQAAQHRAIRSFRDSHGSSAKLENCQELVDLNNAHAAVSILATDRVVCDATFHDLSEGNQWHTHRLFLQDKTHEFSQGLGESRHGIRCIYTPSLVDLCHDSFDCVVIDEAVAIKSEDSAIGAECRRMNPKYRLAMTATPIKNRLPDLFHPSHWATGSMVNAHSRFPYTPHEMDAFADEFLIVENNLTKAAKAKTNRRYTKRTAAVCQIHKLWKMFGPIVLRRRKSDCGEDIVKRHKHLIRVNMGQEQARVYKAWLDAPLKDSKGRPNTGAKLQALRGVAADPTSELLRPIFDPKFGPHRSHHSFTPKMAAAINIVTQCLEQGEQCVVGAAFRDPLNLLAKLLDEAGVPHLLLDGRITPKKRGALSSRFKQGHKGGVPVTLAGVDSVAAGHNWFRCSNIVYLSYSWAYDKFKQFLDRVHRMNSPKDVHAWMILCDGSIERKLEMGIDEKGDASDLVLDGRLIEQRSEEVSLWELLKEANRAFAEGFDTTDEVELAKEWPAMRERLRSAYQTWLHSATDEVEIRGQGAGVQRQVARKIVRPDPSVPKWLQTMRHRRHHQAAA